MNTSSVALVTVEQLTELVKRAVQDALGEQRQDLCPVLLDRSGIAKALGIGLSSVDRLRKLGMPALLVGDSPRFLVHECLTWLQENCRAEAA